MCRGQKCAHRPWQHKIKAHLLVFQESVLGSGHCHRATAHLNLLQRNDDHSRRRLCSHARQLLEQSPARLHARSVPATVGACSTLRGPSHACDTQEVGSLDGQRTSGLASATFHVRHSSSRTCRVTRLPASPSYVNLAPFTRVTQRLHVGLPGVHSAQA